MMKMTTHSGAPSRAAVPAKPASQRQGAWLHFGMPGFPPRGNDYGIGTLLFVGAGVLFLFSFPATASPDAHAPAGSQIVLEGVEHTTASEEPPRWFLMFAVANTYPRLESEKLIKKYFDPAMRFLAPTFDDVKTISDIRDDGLLCPPHLAVGRVLTDHWAVFVQAGYVAGKVRTKANDPSLLLLPLHTDFEIKRGAAYAGIGADFFPAGLVALRGYDGVMARLRAAKPYLGTRLTWTYATYRAKVKAGFKPFGTPLDLTLHDSWLLPSLNANVGFEVPVNARNALSFNAGYSFFADRRFDFEGPALSIAWKYFLRRSTERD